jgi:alpha-galactosidase
VVTNIRQQMERFLDAHPVDFIKWDMNRAPNGAGSLAGEGIWRAHVEALHGLMDGLLARYPKLSIQSCSSGGGRIDAAMLARCCQVWTSDNTDALDRVRIQDGYALCYPSAGMECWVTHTVNHQTHRHLPLDLRFAAAMRGVLGIGSSLDALDEDELAEYAHWIAFYKRMRPLVLGGQLHRAAFPEIDDGLSVWQFTNDDGSEAYVNAIATTHIVGRQCPQYRLADLQAAATYAVSNAAGDCVLRATGAELMGQGLGGTDADQDLANKPGACWHYHLSIEA